MDSRLLIVILGIIWIGGCTQKSACRRPYIAAGSECCLDENWDGECDETEQVTGGAVNKESGVKIAENSESYKSFMARYEGDRITTQVDEDVYTGLDEYNIPISPAGEEDCPIDETVWIFQHYKSPGQDDDQVAFLFVVISKESEKGCAIECASTGGGILDCSASKL